MSLLRKVFLTTKNTKLAQSSQMQIAGIQPFVLLVKILCEPCGKFLRLFGVDSMNIFMAYKYLCLCAEKTGFSQHRGTENTGI